MRMMTVGLVSLVALGAPGTMVGCRSRSNELTPTPTPTPTTPPRAPAPPTRVPPPLPEPPATVVLRLSSDPPGAKVTDSHGQVLGTTPLEWTQQRARGELDLRFEKEGYVVTGLSLPLPLYKDLDTTIRLERRTGKARAADHGSPHAGKTASQGAVH